MTSEIRSRSRGLLIAELAVAASDYCAVHGFEDVTVADLAQGIGISRATFFRLLGSKEDAIVMAARAGREALAARVRDQAQRPGDSAWSAVRAAMQSSVDAARAEPDRLRARIRMIWETPALRARLASDRADEELELAEVLSVRTGDSALGRAVAAAATAAIDLAWRNWSIDDGADFGDALAESFALVGGVERATLVT